MRNYNNLTTSQKRYVSMVRIYKPELKNEITFAQLNELHNEFLKLRPKYKLGFPNWLLVENRIDRGLYFLPMESVDSRGNDCKIIDENDQRYQSLLNKFNLIKEKL